MSAPAAVQLEALGADWPSTACALLRQEPIIARVTVVKLEGSGPREAGSSMLLTRHRQLGSIGGGQLEWRAACAAREMLGRATPGVVLQRYTLGPDLQQCCGGRVELWLERLDQDDLPALQAVTDLLAGSRAVALVTQLRDNEVSRRVSVPDAAVRAEPVCQRLRDGSLALTECWRQQRPPLWIFGAGHVGQAIARLLRELPLFQVHLVDSRAGILAACAAGDATLRYAVDPVASLREAPAQGYFLVMTHDHGLDYALCHALLQRSDFAWLGLIGSASKRARFRSRLGREGLAPASIERLHCPIGVPGIHSKLPQAIAVAVVAQLLQLQQAAASKAEAPGTAMAASGKDCGAGCTSCGPAAQRVRA